MEKFIEKVKQCPCLWDMNHMSYRDIGMKDLVWKRIAKECGMVNGNAAKIEWKKIRDSHREAMRRRKTLTGQPAHNFKPWKYEAQMDFLLPQAENKASYSNINDSQSINDTVNVIEPNDIESLASAPETLPTQRPSQLEKRKQTKLDMDTAIDHQREKRREKKQSERDEQRRRVVDTNRTHQDALSHLFTSFCQKTRELPKYLQLRVQREIFDSVTRAEEEAMSLDSTNAHYSPTSSSTSSYNQNFLPDTSPVTQPSPTYASSPIPDVSQQTQSSYVYTIIKQEEDP